MSWWSKRKVASPVPAGRMRSLRTRACSSVAIAFAGAVVDQRHHGLLGELVALDRRGLDDGALARAPGGPAARPGAPGSSAGRRSPSARPAPARRPRPGRRSSISISTTSTTNSGLPSATSRMRAAVSAPSRAGPSSCRSRSAASASASASEQHRRRVRPPVAPARPAVAHLGTRHDEQQQRRVARPVRDVLEEVHERRLAPLQVVDDERPAGDRGRWPRATCASPRRPPRERPARRWASAARPRAGRQARRRPPRRAVRWCPAPR